MPARRDEPKRSLSPVPTSTPDPEREKILREVRDVEQRLQHAHAELTAVFERRLAEVEGERDALQDTVRRLQRGSMDLGTADAELASAIGRLGRELRAELELRLKSHAEAAGADAATTIARGERRSVLAQSSGLSLVIAGIVTGALAFVQSRCSDAPAHPDRTFDAPTPATPAPGYGGRQ